MCSCPCFMRQGVKKDACDQPRAEDGYMHFHQHGYLSHGPVEKVGHIHIFNMPRLRASDLQKPQSVKEESPRM